MTLQSFYVRVQLQYGTYQDIKLLKCTSQNYFLTFISQPSDQQSALSWILPFASDNGDSKSC